MESAVEGMGLVGGERSTKKDKDDGDERSTERDGEDEREDARLYVTVNAKALESNRIARHSQPAWLQCQCLLGGFGSSSPSSFRAEAIELGCFQGYRCRGILAAEQRHPERSEGVCRQVSRPARGTGSRRDRAGAMDASGYRWATCHHPSFRWDAT